MKKLFILFSVLALLAGFAGVSTAGIVASAHDFSATGWAHQQICLPCHTPHNADTEVQEAPLWNHELSVGPYQMYTSPTMQAEISVEGPTGVSLLCLSCHDGTVSLDAFGGNPGTGFFIDNYPGADLTTDLSNDHPISFTYDAALAAADPGLYDPTVTNVTIGDTNGLSRQGTITEVMLINQELQCSSCHSVHNDYVAAGTESLLKISDQGSQLCLTCHNK